MKKDKEWLKRQLEQMNIGWEESHPEYHRVCGEALKYVNQLDEPEITEEQALNKLAESYPFSVDGINAILQAQLAGYSPVSTMKFIQSNETKVPVIPQFVADWIEINKNIEIDYAFELIKSRAKSGKLDEFDNWVNKNKKMFALAFIVGYKIEKETMYYVIFVESEDKEKGQALYKDFNFNGDKVVSTHIEPFIKRIALEADNFHFTEQEIKAIDERYWAFRKEVPNV